jgi:lipopolysaccharide export system permease protein
MHIIRNYILKEFIGPFFLSILVFTSILVMGNIIQIADLIINKGVGGYYVFKLLYFLIPSLLTFTIPMSLLTATLLAFGKLASDNEIVAMRASGISLFRITLPALVLALVISAWNMQLNEKTLPESGFEARKLIKKIGLKNPTALLEPGVFIKGFKDCVIFIYGMDGNRLKNIRIYQPIKDSAPRTIVAQEGEVETHPGSDVIKLKLKNGTTEEPIPGEPSKFYKLNFKYYNLILDLAHKIDIDSIEKKSREKTTRELRADIVKLKKQGISPTPLLIEIHKKLALSLSNFVLVLFAIPLSIKMHRREKSIGFGLGLLIFMIYWGIQLGGIALSISNVLPAWLGVWSSNIIFSTLGLVLFIRSSRT